MELALPSDRMLSMLRRREKSISPWLAPASGRDRHPCAIYRKARGLCQLATRIAGEIVRFGRCETGETLRIHMPHVPAAPWISGTSPRMTYGEVEKVRTYFKNVIVGLVRSSISLLVAVWRLVMPGRNAHRLPAAP